MLTVVQNTFLENEFIRESTALTIKALEDSGIEYQYIIFNDHGAKSIFEDVKDFLNDKVEYFYSPINYGKRQCSGGWLGAFDQNLVKGDLFQSIGQDDVFTSLFYKKAIEALKSPNIYLSFCNGFKTHENLTMINELLTPLQKMTAYTESPREVFNQWFGVIGNKTTRANNYIPHPGVVYKVELHSKIGLPDLDTFRGTSDFEYWARILFNNLACHHEPLPLWLYRRSKYTAGDEIIDGKHNDRDLGEVYRQSIRDKYDNLLKM